MGYRIENYKRDELRKIALPGHAVSTLFWVLPVGDWRYGELDRWWAHFTDTDGLCRQIGLLLVRDMASPAAGATADCANLAPGLAKGAGGNLLDLIPEAHQYWAEPKNGPNTKSILVLSGAYPQPGWGVLITWSGKQVRPLDFERLICKATELFPAEKLQPIRSAADSYRMRHGVGIHEPSLPIRSKQEEQLKRAIAALEILNEAISSKSHADLSDALTETRAALGVAGSIDLSASFWDDMESRIKMIRAVQVALKGDTDDLAAAVDKFDNCPVSEQTAVLGTLPPKDASFLKKLRYLRISWPELKFGAMKDFISTTYRTDMLASLKSALGEEPNRLKQKLAMLALEYQTEMIKYENDRKAWKIGMKDAEKTFRSQLPEASKIQWEIGPAFLMKLEAAAREQNLDVKSIPWDPARMTGWKLHVSNPGIQPKELLVVANSVLQTDALQIGATLPKGEFNGSLFADYAYFVSISAKRMSPWEATRGLLTGLLTPSQLIDLLGNVFEGKSFTSSTKDELAEVLLTHWGWQNQHRGIPMPLAGCVTLSNSGNATLGKSLNATRITLEGFLKDLVRIAFSTLGWNPEDPQFLLADHCASYKRSTKGSWKMEIDNMSVGGALILLKALLPLAFPQSFDQTATQAFCQDCSKLVDALNIGSHHPPPPPPTPDQLEHYADSIRGILATVENAVGEMPWHLFPDQSFGTEPLIVTGHAWSHCHVEERIIRVMLWAGDKRANELLVWNKSLTNPVMTDAVLL